MKHIIKSLILIPILFLFSSCEEYLDKAPESNLTVEEVFKDFDHAQGFVEEMYALVVDYPVSAEWQTDPIYGDDGYLNVASWWASTKIDQGNLSSMWQFRSSYFTGKKNDPSHPDTFERMGVYAGSLLGIRKANLAIENIDLMVDASQDERDVILGQAYFFRAFFHLEIMKFWGRYPYIDRVLVADYEIPRPDTYKETALRLDEDFQRAADLLPVNWDTKPYGQKTFSENKGRLTRGAAYAFKGKNMLFAASPLMKGSTDTYDYDVELCEIAVAAFAEVLNLADQGVYALVPFDQYEEVFWKTGDLRWPGSTEFIFNGMSSSAYRTNEYAFGFMDTKVTGRTAKVLTSPTHNFIYHNFGMSNGLSIEDDLSGTFGTTLYDPANPFENRDPRFYKWNIIDGDQLADITLTGDDAVHMTAKLFEYGAHRSTETGSRTGYFIKKFYPTYAGKWDMALFDTNMSWRIRMRLTDVYLMYAEALHAAKGSATTPSDAFPLSAGDVVNIMRDRAGIPHVHSNILSDANKFMDELRRERSVELSYESHRWMDIRRWLVAHLPRYKRKTELSFPQNHSYFEERLLVERVCEYPKHYWLPFNPSQTQIYEGFPQNPGW